MECCGDVCYLRILVGREESNGTNYKGITIAHWDQGWIQGGHGGQKTPLPES